MRSVVLVAACCVGGSFQPCAAQRQIQRYPLFSQAPAGSKPVRDLQSAAKAPNLTVRTERVLPPKVEPSSRIQTQRNPFAGQFERAYSQIDKANANRVARLLRPAVDADSKSSAGTSVVQYQDPRLSLADDSDGNVASPLSSTPIEPLPELADVANRFPRTASSANRVGTSGNNNDFRGLPVPPPRNTDSVSSVFQPSDAAVDGSEPNDWWTALVQRPLDVNNQTQQIDSNWLVYMALQNSPRIQALSRDPLIRDFEVVEANAAFDPVSFLRTQFADRSDPLGGVLDATRDGLDTIENHNWTAEGGLRGRARTGATYELSQRLGFQNSNVSVFDPNDQGTAQLALNVSQPLARGRGRYINQSQILLAQSRGGQAWEAFAAELQEEIESVVAGYWRLYYDRSVFLQKKRNVERAASILETLEGRAGLDSLPSQITRARSSLQSRKTDLANAFRDVRNSETELRRLIADRNWLANQNIELLPAEPAMNSTVTLSVQHVVTTALDNRPEIREAIQRAKIAGIEKDISVNDLLPELSLLLGTYVSTLEGDSRVGDAFVTQFGETKPGYSVGLEFELPIRNRAARSRLVQRKLQLAKIKNEVDETMQNVIAESQVSLRRLDSAAATLVAANQAIEAAKGDLDQMRYLFDRYHLRIYNFFQKMVRNRSVSEDLTQDVFAKVIRYRSSYNHGNFASWIFTIARNIFSTYYQKQKME